MAFREYATKEDICRHLCQHKVGDMVTLRKNCKTDTGVCECGTELEIRAITIGKRTHCMENLNVL